MQVKKFLLFLKKQLVAAEITSTPDLEAILLLMHTLNLIHREQLLSLDEKILNDEEITLCNSLLNRRLKQEPIAYILGYKAFWDYQFKVNPAVLIPRPETELIIEAVQRYFSHINKSLEILDLGTGTGCIPITLLKLYPNAIATAIDISNEALEIAKYNAYALDVAERINIFRSNWFENFTTKFEKFDIITANPPYISLQEWQTLSNEVKNYEPEYALTDYKDGLMHYKTILASLSKYLKPSGKAFFEIGYNQNNQLLDSIKKYDYNTEHVFYDLANIPRVICVTL